jgi:two-component system sensor histidine kinase BaeS
MVVSLRARLSLAFALIGLASVLSVSVLVNFFLELQFRKYALRKQEERNRDIAVLVGAQYLGPGRWKAEVIQDIGVSVLEEGRILKLLDNEGRPVWDAVAYNSGICQSMIDRMSRRMLARYPKLQGGLTEQGYPVLAGGRRVGTLQVGTWGPFYFSENDFLFIDALNRLLLWVALGTLAAALASGLLISRRLSAPLVAVTASAGRIASGDYGVQLPAASSTREIRDLVQAINHLARTLGEQESLRRRLTSDVAHELRTPLTTLRSHLEALIDGVWEASPARLKGLHEETLRLGRLVEDLSSLSRYEQGGLELKREPLRAAELAAPVVALWQERFRRKGVSLELRAGAPEAMIRADREKLTQVLTNLLDNALNFTPPGGKVQVSVSAKAGGVELAVEDTGCGIPAEDLPHVFERFYRADPSRARDTGGFGIGLSIVREIVRAHGGTVEVRSAPGRGSEFRVILPDSGAS